VEGFRYHAGDTGGGGKVDAVMSTLVLEHLQLGVFFSAIAGVLKEEGGWAWVTDMHTEMGGSRAGFRDGDGRKVNGRKVNGMSWNHELEETLEAAGKVGLRLEGDVVEMGVREVGDESGEVGGTEHVGGIVVSYDGLKGHRTCCLFISTPAVAK